MNRRRKPRHGQLFLREATRFSSGESETLAHVVVGALPAVVKAIRQKIESLGGEVRFECRVEDLLIRDGRDGFSRIALLDQDGCLVGDLTEFFKNVPY